jgi:serine/threonine-protein kinase
MLIHEAKLAARLNHANIVQVFDLGREGDRLFIAMDYVEGFDLNDLLRRCSRTKTALPFEFSLMVVVDALKGLDYAHRRTDDEGKPLGIVHRDVSPSNLLVSFEGEIKVCDFGIAHANDVVTDQAILSDDAIKGKAGYMSPEHARGEDIDARADVFAVGIVLWELVAGRRMYQKDAGPLLEQAREANIPELPPRDLPAEDRLRAIIAKALSREREQRYPSAQAMLRDLQEYIGESRLVASPIRFGDWLVERFGSDIVEQRRIREQAVESLDREPAVTSPPPTPKRSEPPPARTSSRPPPAALPPKSPMYAAAIDRSPPSSAMAVDVSPPSSQLAAAKPAEPPRSSTRFVIIAVVAVLVALGVIAAYLLAR